MLRILHKIFPIFDYLYILQIMEYELLRFLKWYLKNPFSRNLQKKGKLVLTAKAKLILVLSIILMILSSALVSLFLIGEIDFLIPATAFLLLQQVSPFFLSVSHWFTSPLESFIEYRLISQAKRKLTKNKNLKVVAIAGSYGKTSTKNILYTLLWKKFYVIKTPKSFNTLVSIARTILSDIKDNTEVFIVEMDSYKKGDLTKLSNLVNPDYGILTSIAPQHLERFGDMENLSEAQLELISIVKNTVFLNMDDDWIKKKVKKTKNVVPFGTTPGSSVRASEIRESEGNLNFTLEYNKEKVEIQLPLKGQHHVVNFLAAASVAISLGLSLAEVRERASLILPTDHRLEIKDLNGITLIDNSYNTNPTVSQKSLDLLSSYKAEKILITPGFVELGDKKEEESIKFMISASKVADEIVIVGNNSRKELLKGLKKAKFDEKKTHFVKNTDEGLRLAKSLANTGDAILLENDLPDQYF